MNTIKIRKGRTHLVAHAGLAGLEAINSIAGYVAAANRTYYGIETDIRRTADGHFVAFHDKTLEARAGIEDSIENLTFDQIKDLVLTDRNGSRDRRDTVIPTLKEYIEICKQYEKVAVVELSGQYRPQWIREIITEIDSFGYLSNTTFISFYYDNLRFVRQLLPEQSVQFIFTYTSDEIIDRLIEDRIDADVRFSSVTEPLIRRLHSAGRIVNCYTVDNPDTAAQLIGWGVDFITTNILE